MHTLLQVASLSVSPDEENMAHIEWIYCDAC